jgi:hypothetical protein
VTVSIRVGSFANVQHVNQKILHPPQNISQKSSYLIDITMAKVLPMVFGLFGKHECEICGMESKERLYIGTKLKWFCRRHLIENFKNSFLAFPDKMVVFHPELQKVCKNLYPYYPVAEMSKFGFDEKCIESVEKLLGMINDKCSECSSKAQTLYFPIGALPYTYSNPLIQKIDPMTGGPLCLKHALEKIQIDLQSNPALFNEGLYAPYNGKGMYASTYL